jgi:hypothetical protein
MNVDIDTTDLERVERPAPRPLPPIDSLTLRSPFFVANIPTTSLVNADAVRNFQSPALPSYRITPPLPLTIAGSSTNATPTVSTPTFAAPGPPAPIISQTLKTTTTGYTFSFLQVKLPQNINPNAAVSGYKVYRGLEPTNTRGSVVIQTIHHNPSNNGSPVVVLDSVANNIQFCYFVSSVSMAGVESTLTPAQSGFVLNNSALSSTQQLATSFNNLPLNCSYLPAAATSLSNNGSSPNIAVAAISVQFGSGVVAYNSATVTTGGFGTSYVSAFDPSFQGGAVFFLQSNVPIFQANDQTLAFGKINTVSGSSSTGGGSTGGTSGVPAGRGIIQ